MAEVCLTLREVFDDLKGRGLLDQATINGIENRLSETSGDSESPWYLNVIVTFGAWIAGACFIGFLELTHVIPSGNVAKLLVGVLFIGAATFLNYVSRNLFQSQLALAISVSGHALVLSSVERLFGYELSALAFAAFIIAAFLYPLYRNQLHRFLSCMLVTTITLWWFLDCHPHWFHVLVLAETIGIALILTGLVPLRSLRPLGYACAASLLLALLVECLPLRSVEIIWLPTRIIMIAALLGLYVFLAENRQNLLTEPLIVAMFATVILGMVSAPGILVAIGILVLVFLPVFIGLYYYDMKVDLATKSWMLGLSGAGLLLIRWVLSYRPWAKEGSS
jgi:hypothetical protein